MLKIVYTLCIVSLFITTVVYPHGLHHTLNFDKGICTKVSYDSGEPMSNAQVLVFKPGEENFSWESKTDPQGVFCFKPAVKGMWILQIRDTMGHGTRINIPVEKDSTSLESSSGTALSLTQKILMTFLFLWGCTGTALYFRRKK